MYCCVTDNINGRLCVTAISDNVAGANDIFAGNIPGPCHSQYGCGCLQIAVGATKNKYRPVKEPIFINQYYKRRRPERKTAHSGDGSI